MTRILLIGVRFLTFYSTAACKFKTINNTNSTETGASAVVQIAKVFLAPEIKVKPGSKLSVTQNGVTTEYKSSGEPAFYSTHQEIVLELFKGWA